MAGFVIAKSSRKLESVLDAIATSTGMYLFLAILICTCVGAGLFGEATIKRLEADHAIFRDAQIRNGYVAMSDVQRLVLVSQAGATNGEMTKALKDEFTAAADIIFVRIDNFSRMIVDGQNMETGAASIAALNDVLSVADNAIRDDFSDIQSSTLDVLTAAEIARENLVGFLDVMRRKSERVLDGQSLAVRQQQKVVMATLAGLTLLSGVAFQLLRREVLGRRAREMAEEKVAYLVFNDQLTGLGNRSQFQLSLQKMLDQKRDIALMFLDLDGFKLVNDTYGHAAGDEVLRCVGRLLTEFAEIHKGFAARLGGDEFALVVPSADLKVLSARCEEIIKSASRPLEFEGNSILFGVSIGLATTQQAGEEEVLCFDHLCRVTDFALYESKSKGQNTFSVYDQSLETRFLDRRAMVEELPTAEERGELVIYLQPKIHLNTQKAIGFEALVRWQRGAHLTQPNDFIQVAEETGLIQKIDRFVLRKATRYVADWNTHYGTSFSVSVNLSGLHFISRRIVDWVRQALNESGLPPHLLTLEITETVELRDVDFTNDILAQLREIGVRISIDDFGTGYSSLAYLSAIVADELKIDRSLVTQVGAVGEASQLLKTVLEIARLMKLSVVVEGVENVEQVEILKDLNVQTVQGFFFSRPQPFELALSQHTTSVADAKIAS